MSIEEAKLAKQLLLEISKDWDCPIVSKDLGDPGMNIGEAIAAREQIRKRNDWEQRYKDRVAKLKKVGIIYTADCEHIDLFGNKYENEDVIKVTETGNCPSCGSDVIISIYSDCCGSYDYVRYQCLECKALFEIGWG